MKVFYIDTSSSYLYIGIVEDCKLKGSLKKEYGTNLSKYTMDEIAKLFSSLSLKPNDIDKIIVVSGPGSYTGIRIGMTIAKIYAFALQKEIITITSLDAMALSLDVDKVIVPLIDARRGFVYAGVYYKDTVLMPNQYLKLDDLCTYLDKLNKDYVFISNNSFPTLKVLPYSPDILKIVLKYQDKESINPHLVEPTYFKLTEAEENLRNSQDDN